MAVRYRLSIWGRSNNKFANICGLKEKSLNDIEALNLSFGKINKKDSESAYHDFQIDEGWQNEDKMEKEYVEYENKKLKELRKKWKEEREKIPNLKKRKEEELNKMENLIEEIKKS